MTQELTNVAEELENKADEYGIIPESEREEITVEYETDAGNTRERTGEVWACDEKKFGGYKIRFSQMDGDDEDSYYIDVTDKGEILVSVSEQGYDTNLGDVESFETDYQTGEEVCTDGGVTTDENAEYCPTCEEYHYASSGENAAQLVADCGAGNW